MARVLIVVDEPDTMLELQADMERAGHDTVLAADADTALLRLADGPIDVVVLDVMMPVGDGWTVLEHLGSHRDAPPVIVAGGRATPADLARASTLGATLTSPLTGPAILRAVSGAVADRADRPAATP
ncbi:MAG TPA: response regulator [Acidimicrobiales bacterium]|jgi:CheY-like chemotaxis protein|nr:response regulator [Acidimicrobiales bacterium]